MAAVGAGVSAPALADRARRGRPGSRWGSRQRRIDDHDRTRTFATAQALQRGLDPVEVDHVRDDLIDANWSLASIAARRGSSRCILAEP